METIGFEAAIRRLLSDAVWNFKTFRGALRAESDDLIANYNGTYQIEGALDAYVHQLDYAVPVARLVFYDGRDEAAAELVFDSYSDRLRAFATDSGMSASSQQDDDECGESHVNRWSWITYRTQGPPISMYRTESIATGEGQRRYYVYAHIPGFAVECINGSPDDSIWRIILGDK